MSAPTPPRNGHASPSAASPAPAPAPGGRLACGADPDALLEQVAEGRGAQRDDHQDGCLHCQATLAEYTRLWAPFDELAATPTPAPAAVLDRALAAIREQAGPTGWGRVEDPDDPAGAFLVAARVVVAVAGHAARTSAGVRMALGALGELTNTLSAGTDADAKTDAKTEAKYGVNAGVTGQSVAVELTVAAEYGHDLHSLARHLRTRVVEEVAAQTGLQVVEVDVAITDVFAPPPTHQPAERGAERSR